jgi:hypothetical protein
MQVSICCCDQLSQVQAFLVNTIYIYPFIMIYTVLGIDNNNKHDTGTVPHNEQLEIKPHALSMIEQIFKVCKWDSA